MPAPPSNRAPQAQAAPGKIGRCTTRARRGDLSLQTDPIGYGDGLNWYAYVGNDPLNRTDPTGMQQVSPVVVEGCGPSCQAEKLEKAREAIDRMRWALQLARWGGGGIVGGLRLAFDPTIEPLGNGTICASGGNECLFNAAPDIDDPGTLEGATPEEVEEAAKAKGYTERPGGAANGKGKVYVAGNGADQVRVMTGGGNRTGADAGVKEGGPYAIVSKHGTKTVVPLAGNKALGSR